MSRAIGHGAVAETFPAGVCWVRDKALGALILLEEKYVKSARHIVTSQYNAPKTPAVNATNDGCRAEEVIFLNTKLSPPH